MRKSMPLRNNVIHDAFSIAFIKIGHDQEEKRISTKSYTDNTNRDQLD